MLDAVTLSEEELGLLFAPASHGAGGPSSGHRQLRAAAGRKSSSQARVSGPPAKHAAKKAVSKVLVGDVVPARCGYRTGKCQNLQAIKRNGRLHKLCEFHRERANLNQKKLDRKKRLQRSKRSAAPSPCESVSSEDDSRSVDLEDRSPRTVEAAVTSSVLAKAEPETTAEPELLPPTSLHEAPLALGCEELAIFCSLMAFDINHRAPVGRETPPVPTAPCHYYTGIV
ncbi:unnamed protein product [Phytophthora lilii]|uniref:Unnamed protein product n=1 Tax=Phytophthora lilii TaxID=2077276 RepID=A0A9W6TBD2_9STRA|nr:unnamed protein product [Phytophthora lilii]